MLDQWILIHSRIQSICRMCFCRDRRGKFPWNSKIGCFSSFQVSGRHSGWRFAVLDIWMLVGGLTKNNPTCHRNPEKTGTTTLSLVDGFNPSEYARQIGSFPQGFFCKAQAMIAERKILLCKLLSSGESETIEIKTLQHHCVYPWRIGEAF